MNGFWKVIIIYIGKVLRNPNQSTFLSTDDFNLKRDVFLKVILYGKHPLSIVIDSDTGTTKDAIE